MRAYAITLILCISMLSVYSSQAGSGTTKTGKCCYPEQMTGNCESIVGSEVVARYEFYADFKKKKALHIAPDQNRLFDLETGMLYIFTETGCTKSRLPAVAQQCIREDAELVSRIQARALNGKGWRWLNKWTFDVDASPDKMDKADSSKKTIHELYSDEKTCYTEKAVTIHPDGTSFTYLTNDIRPVIDDPAIFDLDVSQCVGDVTDTTKTEL